MENICGLEHGVGKILKNEVYIGSVVGRKFQKVSHKVEKVRLTKKEEHIVIKNMHEPIIDIKTWNKAQEKINKYQKVRERKYEHPLKGLVYCGECGNKATLRCREEKRQNGNVWRSTNFICSKRNNYSGLCDCKQISAIKITEKVQKAIQAEISKIRYKKEELEEIFRKAEIKSNTQKNLLNKKIKELQNNLEIKERDLEELYSDKIEKIISLEDFKIFYKKMQKEKEKIISNIEKMQNEIKNCNQKNTIIDYSKIKEIADNFLEMKNPDKQTYEKLIKKIEIFKDRTINVELNFAKMDIK